MSNVVGLFDPPPQPTTEIAPTQFEAIWSLWPNKSKKPLARAKYAAILKGCKTRTMDKDSGMFVEIELEATEDQIVAGIKKYLASQVDKNTYSLKDNGKYIPHLATFLNQGRWEDFE